MGHEAQEKRWVQKYIIRTHSVCFETDNFYEFTEIEYNNIQQFEYISLRQ